MIIMVINIITEPGPRTLTSLLWPGPCSYHKYPGSQSRVSPQLHCPSPRSAIQLDNNSQPPHLTFGPRTAPWGSFVLPAPGSDLCPGIYFPLPIPGTSTPSKGPGCQILPQTQVQTTMPPTITQGLAMTGVLRRQVFVVGIGLALVRSHSSLISVIDWLCNLKQCHPL